jgi:hypothetical protein
MIYDNRALALEMLANCNIDKSFDVVSGIYWWYYDWLKTANNWNTVNVKAMRNACLKTMKVVIIFQTFILLMHILKIYMKM